MESVSCLPLGCICPQQKQDQLINHIFIFIHTHTDISAQNKKENDYRKKKLEYFSIPSVDLSSFLNDE